MMGIYALLWNILAYSLILLSVVLCTGCLFVMCCYLAVHKWCRENRERNTESINYRNTRRNLINTPVQTLHRDLGVRSEEGNQEWNIGGLHPPLPQHATFPG